MSTGVPDVHEAAAVAETIACTARPNAAVPTRTTHGPVPRLRQRDEQRDRSVEEPTLEVGMVVLRLEELERHVDHDRADDRSGDAPDPAEDDNRKDENEDVEREVAGHHRSLDRCEDPAAEPGQRRTHDDGETLEPVHGNAHHLGREGILTKRAPGAPGPRPVRKVEAGRREDEHAQEEVVLLFDRRQVVAEEAERVDVADPTRAAREADAVDHGVRRVREHEKRLQEEERDDREVVADEPPRRKAEDRSPISPVKTATAGSEASDGQWIP